MPAVLFVCRANQFRSPIAAASLKRIARRLYPDERWMIGSAGTLAADGLPAADITVEAARRLHLPGLEKHVTRQVNVKLLDFADVVLVMDSGQREALRYEFPAAAGRIYQLSEVAEGMAYDILDPADARVAPEEVSRALYNLVTNGGPKILELARKLYKDRQSTTD